jgi:hypothetical protein
MSCRLKNYLPELKRLKRASKKERVAILKKADDGLISCLSDCAYNTLNSNLPLSGRQYKNLSRHKRILRVLANKRICLKRKRKAVVRQCGGFILPLLAPILGAILQGLILK